MVIINTLINEIQRKYTDGCPNGFLLEWDVNRFFQPLLSLFTGFRVINNTDFNYSYCNSYEVELGENGDREVYILTVKISFILDAFALHVTKYSSNRRIGEVIPFDDCMRFAEEIAKIKKYFEGKGFFEIKEDVMDIVVDGVDLELAETATVGKCLFDDFE